jgi:hypothetical protein
MATNPKLSSALRGNQNAKGPHKKGGALNSLVKGSTAAGEKMNSVGRSIGAKISGVVSDAKTNAKFAMRSPRDAAEAAKASISGAVSDLEYASGAARKDIRSGINSVKSGVKSAIAKGSAINKSITSGMATNRIAVKAGEATRKQIRGRFGDGGGGTARKIGASVGGAVAKVGMATKGAVKGARVGLAVAKGTNAVTDAGAKIKGVFKKESTGDKIKRTASNIGNSAKAAFRGAKIGAKVGSTVASATGAGRMQGAAKAAAASTAVRKAGAATAAGAKSAVASAKRNYPELRGRIAGAQVKAGDAVRRKFNLKARRKGM